MTTLDNDPVRAALASMASASDPADVVGAVTACLARMFGGGCSVDLMLPGVQRVPFVFHNQRELVPRMREARGTELIEDSEHARQALGKRRVITTSFGKQSDPIERVRLALRAESAIVLPLIDRTGVVVIYGRPPRDEALRWVELIIAAAGATIQRIVVTRASRAEIAIRDASIAMLASLSEQSPIPTAFFDHELRLVVANDAFVAYQGVSHERLFRAGIDELDLPDVASIRRAVRAVLASGKPSVSEITSTARAIGLRRSALVAVHSVPSGGALAAVGLTLMDVSARRRSEDAARALAHASTILSGAPTVRGARDGLLEVAQRTLGDVAILTDREGTVAAAPRTLQPALESLLRALPSDDGPERARNSGVPFAVARDDLAIQALTRDALRAACDALDARALLNVPLGEGLVLTVARNVGDYAAEELAFAADLSRLAQKAFEAAAAREEVRSWSELFTDFLGMVSRDLRDPITALVARLFVAQHAPERDASQHLAALRRHAERLRDVAQRVPLVAPRPPEEARDAIDVASLIREASEGARAVAMTRGAQLVSDLAVVPPIAGDRRRLLEALRDVLAHAANEAPAGGVFCVRLESSAHEVSISVSHNGQGLAAADARRVFDALWDGRAEGRALTIARAVFAAHGGRAWVETAPASGTAYCFALPIEQSVRGVA